MAEKPLKQMYREIHPDLFPKRMEISFTDDQQRQTIVYEKVEWIIDGKRKGLRYGENPSQEAALYRMINGNLCLGEVECIQAGKYLASDIELLQSGKHPGKINITDADSALNILRYFTDRPCSVVIKHNNPSGVALGESLADSYYKALMADRIAAFGGAVAVNGAMDRETAELISESYNEVVLAPSYEEGSIDILKKRKNLRIMEIKNMERLADFVAKHAVDFTSLIDGGLVVQWSYVPEVRSKKKLIKAETDYKGKHYEIKRMPNDREFEDMVFGWLVISGVTSNSVIYVKDGVTIGIGTGEQDRVGVAEIARDKAYKKMAERLSWESHKKNYGDISDHEKKEIDVSVREERGGIKDSVMISDAFFPFRDGIDVGIREGITAVLEPGGSIRDFESIEACNESAVAMMFTGERSFRH